MDGHFNAFAHYGLQITSAGHMHVFFYQPGDLVLNITFDWFKRTVICQEHDWLCSDDSSESDFTSEDEFSDDNAK